MRKFAREHKWYNYMGEHVPDQSSKFSCRKIFQNRNKSVSPLFVICIETICCYSKFAVLRYGLLVNVFSKHVTVYKTYKVIQCLWLPKHWNAVEPWSSSGCCPYNWYGSQEGPSLSCYRLDQRGCLPAFSACNLEIKQMLTSLAYCFHGFFSFMFKERDTYMLGIKDVYNSIV